MTNKSTTVNPTGSQYGDKSPIKYEAHQSNYFEGEKGRMKNPYRTEPDNAVTLRHDYDILADAYSKIVSLYGDLIVATQSDVGDDLSDRQFYIECVIKWQLNNELAVNDVLNSIDARVYAQQQGCLNKSHRLMSWMTFNRARRVVA